MIFVATTPIIFVLIGMLYFKKAAHIVAPLAALYTVILASLLYSLPAVESLNQSMNGILDGARMIILIWSAFTMLTMMQLTGAMDNLKQMISILTNDKRYLLIIVAFLLGVFLEGAAGAGTPAAISAPFLVGLGFTPFSAATAALISNSVPVSWGGAGVTTIASALKLSDHMSVAQASAMVGRIHMFGALVVPSLLLIVIYGRKALKGMGKYLIFISIIMSLSIFIVSNFISPELTSLGSGLIGIISSVVFLSFTKTETPEEYKYESNHHIELNIIDYLKSASPYILLLILLPTVRFSFPLATLTKFGYTIWVATVIFISVSIGSIILSSSRNLISYLMVSFKKVIPAFVAMASLLIVANIMKSSGMITIIASSLTSLAGNLYPIVTVAVGALGSFMTGTALGSNLMFGEMHVQAAISLSLSPIVIFSIQNSGASIGNMICPNNVVATATTVGLLGEEGSIIKRVIPAFTILFILYSLIGLIYTHILFV